jgi:hypothetical protein
VKKLSEEAIREMAGTLNRRALAGRLSLIGCVTGGVAAAFLGCADSHHLLRRLRHGTGAAHRFAGRVAGQCDLHWYWPVTACRSSSLREYHLSTV